MGKVKKKTEFVKIADEQLSEIDEKANEVLPQVTTKVPAANSLTKQRISKLLRMFCIYQDLIKEHKVIMYKDCSACILREISWKTKNGQVKDLCYAIWHEGVLNG